MNVPVGKDVTPEPCPSTALSLCSVYSTVTFTGRDLTGLPGPESCTGSLDAAPSQSTRSRGQVPCWCCWGAACFPKPLAAPVLGRASQCSPGLGQAGRTQQLARPVQTNLPSVP